MSGAGGAPIPSSLAIVGARVHCMDERGTVAEAIAVRGDTVAAVGDRESVLCAVGGASSGASVIDAEGALVLPGFIDAHHHVTLSALYGGLLRLAPPAVRDIASLQAVLEQASQKLAPGRWLVAMDWDEQLLAERRAPTRVELDDAVGDRPVLAIHNTCHRAVANSRALEMAGIGRDSVDPPGGAIGRDRKGIPNGLLIERGMSRVESMARRDLAKHDAETFLEKMAAHYRALVRAGITRVVDMSVPIDLLPLFQECVRRDHVLVPTIVCPVSSTGYLEEPWDLLEGPRTGEQFGPITIGPAKLAFDGVPGCSMCLGWGQFLAVAARTCLLAIQRGSLDPLRLASATRPRLGRKVLTGIAIYQSEAAERVIGALVERGFAVATHAVGNRAVDVVLGAYAAHGASVHAAGTARIEHACYVDRAAIPRIADSGAAVVVQPTMFSMSMFGNAPRIPGLPCFPLRTLLDAKLLVAGSSDYPVVHFDPLDGVRSAVTRRNLHGVVCDPTEQISVDEAIALYTRSAAAVCGCLDETGTLEAGKRADIVVLDGSLEQLETLRVRRTIVGGKQLFDAAAC